MAIKMPPAARAAKPKLGDKDERAAAFIAGASAPRAPDPETGKTVVNSRWDTALLKRIDEAAKAQGITRTAWLHVAAAEKLGR